MKCVTSNNFVPIATFVPYVRQFHARAPIQVIEVQLQAAAIDFTRVTGIIERTYRFGQQADVEEYRIDPACDLEFHAINCVLVNGCAIKPIIEDKPGTCGYFYEPVNSLMIRPPSRTDRVDNVEFEATMVVSPDACNVPSVLFRNWRDVIAKKAAANLHRMPDLEGSNLTISREYEGEYREDRGRALSMAQRQHTRAPIRAVVPRMI